ncbi:MAG: hypothetical protein C0501_24080 [Isosphaera sp.]|nr:hypothetical protein [Isosphaera sp.]
MTRAPLAPTAAALLLLAGASSGQQPNPAVKEPPRAEKLDIQVRYRIRADRDERIRQFRVLEKHLAALGFDDARKDEPDRELDILDPAAERFTGTIPSARVLEVLDDPRVETILFAPAGYPYPETRDTGVPVRVVIRGGLIPALQQVLHGQVLGHLERLGYRDALGYDTRGYTQLKGTFPLKYLDRLVKDLRTEPAGWFLADTQPDQLPRPLAERNPVRWVEVMPPRDAPAPFTPAAVPPAQLRLTPELRALVADPARKETPVRVVVLFVDRLEDRTEELRVRLQSAYGSTVRRTADGAVVKGPDGLPALTEGAALEGVAGNLAAIRFDRPADAERFATEPGVMTVRLPPQAGETVRPLTAAQKPAAAADVLKGSGVDALHRLGYTGTGVKVLVIGTDFTGAERLTKKTRLLDLTTELNPDLVPLPADPLRTGHGTAAAQAVAVSAPDADLVLVRVDPGSLFQLFSVLRLAKGEITYTDALRSRLNELSERSGELTRRKDAAVAAYRAAFDDLADDQVAVARRAQAQANLNAVIAEQAELTKRVGRFNEFRKDVTAALAGGRVVVNTLAWDGGYPLDALSELSRTLERLATPLPPRLTTRAGDPAAQPKPPVVWVQAASAAAGSVWGGPFRDANRDETMEFGPPGGMLPPGNWSPDLNFLGVRSATGETAPDLPAGTRVRFAMQWREPLDPNFPSVDRPLYPVVLRVFRQLDPTGTRVPSDEMAEEARSAGGPYPIYATGTFAVFEQVLEFTTAAAGRYALVATLGYRPEPPIPALKREIEIYPRVVVETPAAKPGEGRVVFRSYVSPDAGVGVPGDSAGAVAVGVCTPDELSGAGTGLALRAKPDIFGPESVGSAHRGPGVAAGYLGGVAAGLVQAGAVGADVFRAAGFEPGKLAVVPGAWLRHLRPAGK